MSRNIRDGAHRKPSDAKGVHALCVFGGALLLAPSLLFFYLLWRRAMQSGEMIVHVQGLPWMACIWLALCLCATAILWPLSRLPRWAAFLTGGLLAPLLGALMWMLYNVR
ncbi:hypothetical protein SAMN05428989_1892 [Pseudoxanthomonas sp. GM95]|uniref:hypothetical protein n=1 Tax=Pseudoxanthomonas sp. GM95 TaxID=1881043 RepID=UPI0008AE6E2E|nr:hypothetical protein [Pseudoxanthomonas sp. GM95]SEL54676.1 hypothetical protein SAMN05428989_1892 [Pseudoxanthomonas sp. GM95]